MIWKQTGETTIGPKISASGAETHGSEVCTLLHCFYKRWKSSSHAASVHAAPFFFFFFFLLLGGAHTLLRTKGILGMYFRHRAIESYRTGHPKLQPRYFLCLWHCASAVPWVLFVLAQVFWKLDAYPSLKKSSFQSCNDPSTIVSHKRLPLR